MNQLSRLQLPYGVIDYLPQTAKRKRMLEETLINLFEAWGYQEVITPTLEFSEIFAGGDIRSIDQGSVFQLFDRESGKTLVLRPDMTMPIARLVAGKLKNNQMPQRLCYLSNVFRYAESQVGRQREFYQAGVEFIGNSSPDADAEVIALAIKSLRKAGINDFRIAVGQVDFIKGLTEEVGLAHDKRRIIEQALSSKNIVLMEKAVKESILPEPAADFLLQIPTMRGKLEVIERARSFVQSEKALAALVNIAEVFKILCDYQMEKDVIIDLGMVCSLHYYTGIVFEGFTPYLGFPVCSGGRYDNLIGEFGFECPATGFALGIDRVLCALEQQYLLSDTQEQPTNPCCQRIRIFYTPAQRQAAIAKAQELRQAGHVVELNLLAAAENVSAAAAQSTNTSYQIFK